MRIGMSSFAGEIPSAQPYYLPERNAAFCVNARLDNGELAPLRGMSTRHTLPNAADQIYLHGEHWLGFAGDADCVPGPVATDRLYITEPNRAPRLRVDGAFIPLALPAPNGAPSASRIGQLDANVAEDFAYAYTWVTSLGEESAPSPLSAPVRWSSGTTVKVSNLAGSPPANRLVSKKRIYRAATSASGATGLFFVAEIEAGDTSYIHNPLTAPDQEGIKTMQFAPPPTGLTGLTAMPNGMMAAFRGKELWFCEPYQPHAWPLSYVLTTNDWIVGLAAFGTSLAVLTTGTPYVVQGLHPDQMVMEKSEMPFPCLAKRSIVDMGYSAIYASTDGLVEIGAGAQARLISGQFWNRQQWQERQPANIRAGRIGTRYAMASKRAGQDDLSIDLIDTSGNQPFVVPTTCKVRALYTQIETGAMFVLGTNRRTIAEFDAHDAPPLEYVWRSKPFRLAPPQPFGAAVMVTDGTGGNTTMSFLSNGQPVVSTNTTDTPWRLPSGAHGNVAIELRGTATIISAAIGHTLAEVSG